jgi:hypothetical protein
MSSEPINLPLVLRLYTVKNKAAPLTCCSVIYLGNEFLDKIDFLGGHKFKAQQILQDFT